VLEWMIFGLFFAAYGLRYAALEVFFIITLKPRVE